MRDSNGRFIGGVYGPATSRWSGGRRKASGGYILIYAPDHPKATNKKNGKYIYEHVLIAEQKLGRYLESEECVHHINGIRDDNRPENLHVDSKAAHHSFHAKLKRSQAWIDSMKRRRLCRKLGQAQLHSLDC